MNAMTTQPERQPCRASVRIGCPDSPTTLACHQPTPHPGLNHYDAAERIYWQRTNSEPWLLASPAIPVLRDLENTMTTERAYAGLAEQCNAPHESNDITGFRCERELGHTGEHLTWEAVTWYDDAPAPAAGRDPAVVAFTTPEDGPYMTLDEVHEMAAKIAGRDPAGGAA